MRIFPEVFLSLRTKLILASAMTVLVTVFLMFMASALFFQEFIEDQFKDKLRDKAFIIAMEYGHKVHDLQNQAEDIADDRPVVVLTSLELGQRLGEYLQASLKPGVVDFISVVSPKGVVFARAANVSLAGDSVAFDPFVEKALGGHNVSGAQLVGIEDLKKDSPAAAQGFSSGPDDAKIMLLKAAANIYSDVNREMIGVLVLGCVVNHNTDVGGRFAGLAEAFAVLQGERIIITNIQDKKGALISGQKISILQDGPLNPETNIIVPAILGGKSYLVGYNPIKDINNVVIGLTAAAIDIEEINVLKRNSSYLLLFIALAGIAFAIVLNLFIARSVVRPIVDLGAKIRTVGEGNLDLKVWTGTNDEVGQLSRTFDQMTENLKKVIASRDELDREIEIRRKTEADLRSTQAQLVQSEKMASLGQLSAGVAHEINNPLLFIMGNLTILRDYLVSYNQAIEAGRKFVVAARPDAVEPAKRQIEELSDVLHAEKLEDIIKDTNPLLDQTLGGLERVKKIVLDLKTFSRAGTDLMENNDINQIVEGAINICLNEFKYRVELIRAYGELPLVMCDAQKIGQVFVNLFLNAVQAIEGKGMIHIETSQKNDMVCVKIKDSGKGIPKENLKKIFDPFFTTKPKGTGLGLSVSYDIIKRHGGEIVVESDLGRGTVMMIMLPLNKKSDV